MAHSEWITGILKDNPQGLTIEELSSRTKLHRTTIRNILSELKGQQNVTERPVGRAKMFYWKFKSEEMRKQNGV